jgi:hypothetical protein
MATVANECVAAMGDRAVLNAKLLAAHTDIRYCTHLYVMGSNGTQISDSVTGEGRAIA